MENLNDLKLRLQELAGKIKETKSRLPAHSAKLPIMTELFELEDEYDTLLQKIEGLKKKT